MRATSGLAPRAGGRCVLTRYIPASSARHEAAQEGHHDPLNTRQQTEHDLMISIMRLSRARYSALLAGDHALAESIAAVRLQAADLMHRNATRAEDERRRA